MEPHAKWNKDASSALSEVEQAVNPKPLKINPDKVLTALGNLRIERSRIRPLDGNSASNARGGGFGVVVPAVLDPDASNDNAPTIADSNFVAVKKLHYGENADVNRMLAQFALEIKLLSDLSHQNVAKIIGFVEEAAEGIAWMVFRWEKKGNLREFVRSAKWELPERVSLVDDVARGLAYLHERRPPICHGDLKSLNILVNEDNRAMITDFGSARAIDSQAEEPTMPPAKMVEGPTEHSPVQRPSLDRLTAELLESSNSVTMTGPAWTIRWAAPELLLREGALPTLASDIWALGWIFWEGITGNFPFEDESKDARVVVRIISGGLPALETDAELVQIKALCSLMGDCWSLNPNERPSARACLQRLSFLSQNLPSKDPGSRSCSLLLALGRIQVHNDNHNNAANYFQEAKNAAESAEDWSNFAESVECLGDVYRLRNEFSEAEELYVEPRDIFSLIGSEMGYAECVQNLGHVYRMRSKYSEAEEAYTEARDVFSLVADQQGFAECVEHLGDVHLIRDQYSEAEEAYVEARDVFSQIGDRQGFAECIQRLGDVHQMRDEYSMAEEAYIQARDVFSEIGDRLDLAQCVRRLGHIYQMRYQYSEAEEAYMTARDVFSQVGDRLAVTQCVQSLAGVYFTRDEYSEAEEAYTKARDVFSQIGYELGVAQCVRGLGEVRRMQDDYSGAEEAYIKAGDVFAQVGDRMGAAQCVQSLGEVYKMQNRYSEAEEVYVKARDVFSEIGHRLGFAQCLQGLGDIYRIRKEDSEADDAYIKARDIFSQIGDQLGVSQCVQSLGDAYRMRNEYSEAAEAHTKARDIFSQIGDQLGVDQCVQSLGEVYPMQNKC